MQKNLPVQSTAGNLTGEFIQSLLFGKALSALEGEAVVGKVVDTFAQEAKVVYNAIDEPLEKTANNILKSFNPEEIRFSQSSISGANEITTSMNTNGWQGAPIDIIKMPDGVLTSIDNTRLASARQARIDVVANVHGYNDLLTLDQMSRFATKKGIPTTWGEAIEFRVGKQNAVFKNSFPWGSHNMPKFN